jgi:hypothetical protein
VSSALQEEDVEADWFAESLEDLPAAVAVTAYAWQFVFVAMQPYNS